MSHRGDTERPDHGSALRQWSAQLRASGARGLILLAGDATWAEPLIEALSDETATAPWRIPGDSRVDSVLGEESTLVELVAGEALYVDLLAAAAGAVRAGGILIVTVPTLEAWTSGNDHAVQRHLSHGWDPASHGDRFLDRLRRLIAEHPEAWILTPSSPPTLPDTVDVLPAPPRADDPACVTEDQAQAVDAVQRVAHGRARRPLILAADRGRGKSTALGIAARRLLDADPSRRLVVTAPRRASAARILEQVDVAYQPPDELLRHDHPADLLLVDEAAGIPMPTLRALSQRYARLVFATTVHGYEGTGRGFALRFDDHLRQDGHHPRRLDLIEPIRWRADDPLERLVNAAMLLDAEPPEPTGELARLEHLDRDSLANDESRLRRVFGLLVGAHYRTRPADLRQLLDAPEIAIHIAVDTDDNPLGVVVTADEGPLPEALQEPIWLGTRRLRGHLTPQSLATHAGQAPALALAYRRIVRIAVAPSRRREGIGRALVGAVVEAARADGFDAVSASFGATPKLMPFWRALDLWPVRLGHRRDRASGTHSAIVLRALDAPAGTLADRLRDGLQEQLVHHLPGAFQDLEPALIRELTAGLTAPELTDADWWQIAAFAVGQRSRLDALPALTRLTWWALAGIARGEPDREIDALIRAILQQASEADTAEILGVNGQRACLAALRRIVHGLGREAAPPEVRAFLATPGDASTPTPGDD